MSRYQLAMKGVLSGCLCLAMGLSLKADERDDRIAAGNQFLNASRIDQWEKYFSEGLPKMGKIVMYGNLVIESWFDKGYTLIETKWPDGRVEYFFSNPDYSASVRSRRGENRLAGTWESNANSELLRVDAVPFAVSSSVNFTRELIPRCLKNNKLRISDYRHQDQKHFVELELIDGSVGGKIELIFRDDNPSMLPDETIFFKGEAQQRHFINTEFEEVLGYHIPLRIEDKNVKDGSSTEILPDETLDKARCRLSHYGLPEPKK